MTRVVFMGTPDFAVPSLRALVTAGYQVVAVYTQPDRPAGRGQQLLAPPVKRVAQELGLPVFQPPSLRPAEEVERLAALAPEVIVVAAFGQILRPNVITIPPRGVLNVHASLLPRWRGAAPVPAAILAGDSETGVTIMQIDPGLDTGPLLAQRAIPIAPDDTTGTLTAKLAVLGAQLLVETLPRWLAGEVVPCPQDESQATLAPRIRVEDANLDWTRPAEEIARAVRAYNPWPGARTWWRGKLLTILAAEPDPTLHGEPGEVLLVGRQELAIATGHGALRLREVQLEGRRPLPVAAFRAGQRDLAGLRLPSPGQPDFPAQS
jgi:methionyl-tRNA formyltransferase